MHLQLSVNEQAIPNNFAASRYSSFDDFRCEKKLLLKKNREKQRKINNLNICGENWWNEDENK